MMMIEDPFFKMSNYTKIVNEGRKHVLEQDVVDNLPIET